MPLDSNFFAPLPDAEVGCLTYAMPLEYILSTLVFVTAEILFYLEYPNRKNQFTVHSIYREDINSVD